MPRLPNLGIRLDPLDEAILDHVAEDKGLSRSEILRIAIKECVNSPEMLGDVIARLMNYPVPPASGKPKKKTSVLVEDHDIDLLDGISKRTGITRNALEVLIVRGVNIGIIASEHKSLQ